MQRVCNENKCTGCMACVEICPKGAICIRDDISSYNAVIDTSKCINCGVCHSVCQVNHNVELSPPICCYQGWIGDEQLRMKSSSGGAAMALARAFIDAGGAVCSCVFEKGIFGFRFVEDKSELRVFTGSKYVKSNSYGVYKETIRRLKDNKKTLFIGLPCQVAALKNATKDLHEIYKDNLYTVDLICHGTPSPKLLEDFLYQNDILIKDIKDIQFRRKAMFGLSSDTISLTVPGACDYYSLAFLCGLMYTDNCYECRYATVKRVSDLTIGDSWGTDLNQEEQKKGISLILCQSKRGIELLTSSDMKLFPVNLNRAIQNNAQLSSASEKTKLHDRFYRRYQDGRFQQAVFYALPFKCIKQKIKGQLIKNKLLEGGVYSISVILNSKTDG